MSTARLAHARRRSAIAAAVLLGSLVGFVGFMIYQNRGARLPEVTANELTAARQQWSKNEVPSYDLRVRVQGRQAAVYEVQVRDGEVAQLLRNGKPLTQPRTMATWSVPGMFATIATDVRNNASRNNLLLRAEFDVQHGYPARYQRVERVKHGANPEVTWEVELFQKQ